MAQINLADRLSFHYHGKNKKNIQPETSIFQSQNSEGAFTRALRGLRAAYLIIWWLVATVSLAFRMTRRDTSHYTNVDLFMCCEKSIHAKFNSLKIH